MPQTHTYVTEKQYGTSTMILNGMVFNLSNEIYYLYEWYCCENSIRQTLKTFKSTVNSLNYGFNRFNYRKWELCALSVFKMLFNQFQAHIIIKIKFKKFFKYI